ncbi:hypothetical protein [Chitinophaga nivalis]|uniref:Peptidase S74 domain-containing protein n=1 Tax=Chitinophaga nivalis TaxID=2991709 RepID=A0ABT3IIB5_9BACT|nr:hypothetical protein [Chitinophaga nivalis]MCW3466599.1 hypothetical protein [Chitinophaga nivalis]MCW3483710.1 hypothetical protein [Chitinophaga nivalis]
MNWKTCQRFLYSLIVMMTCHTALHAQVDATYSLNGVTQGTNSWVKAGTINLMQGGRNATITFYGGNGFNADPSQLTSAELTIRTSNGSSLDAQGFGVAAIASRQGRSGGAFSAFKLVPNAAGAAATAYDVYFLTGSYVGVGFYRVVSAGGTWTHSMVIAADPGEAAYKVSMGFRTQDDNYLANSLFISGTTGNVAIGNGAADPQIKLAVNGDIKAKRVKVTAKDWPDFVFAQDYPLRDIAALEQYIHTHHRLPEIPAATEMEANGQDLGEINRKLMQKVEELTLYIIQLNKKNQDLDARLQALEKK